MKINHFAFYILLIWGVQAFAKEPAWFISHSQKRNGKIIEISCSGQGPDKALANQVSLEQCHAIGVQYVQGYAVKTKSLSVEDATQATWHSESSSSVVIEGLECEPLKNECSENSETWKCYNLCRFNLAKAKIENIKNKHTSLQQEPESLVLDNNSEFKEAKNSGASFRQSENQTIILNTVPQCSDLLIVGSPSRVISCSEMPLTVIVNKKDQELIARKSGYQPKHIRLNQNRKTSLGQNPETVTVLFEK